MKHFTTVSKWNGWNNKQKAKQLVMTLEVESINLLGELSDDVLRNYEFVVRYDPIERAQAWKIKF